MPMKKEWKENSFRENGKMQNTTSRSIKTHGSFYGYPPNGHALSNHFINSFFNGTKT
jgi:hypothetical protein